MLDRFARAVALGCHAVSPTRMNCFQSAECRNGLSWYQARQYQVSYNRWLGVYAHGLGLSISYEGGIEKKDQGLSFDLSDLYDFAIGLHCFALQNCYQFGAFTPLNKAVFNHEFDNSIFTVNNCAVANIAQLNTIWCSSSGIVANLQCNSGGWNFCQPKVNKLNLLEFTTAQQP
jgi:hypothetical protein